jgi:hypothetical protein
MLAASIAFIVVGVIFLFFIPWVGIPVGIIGLILLGYSLYAARQAATTETR